MLGKKCQFYGVKNRVFFSFAPKRHLGQSKVGTYICVYTARQGLSESPSYDLTWSKNSFFQFFDILRVPGPHVMESRIDAYIMIQEVNSYHNICSKLS